MPARELDKTTYKALADLKAYYRFESGALTADSSSNSRTLTAIGTPTETTGIFGGGVQLTASSSQAYSIVDAADVKPTGSFTVGAWVKTSTTGALTIFQSYSQNTNIAGIRFLLFNGTVGLVSGRNTGTSQGTNYQEVNGTTTVNDNAWHMVVASWDGSTLRAYVDGKLDGSTAWANAPAYAATNYVRVGCRNNTGTDTAFFDGVLDDLFFYNGIALSNEAIKEIYENRSVGELYPQSNLVALYHLSDTTDYSGNGYNLTNNNSVTFSDYGKFSKCANFGTANTNKNLSISNALGIDGTAITMSCWVKLNTEITTGTYEFIATQNATSRVAYLIWYNYNSGNRIINFYRLKQNVAFEGPSYSITLGTSNWYHIALTYDLTTIKGYVNGQLVAGSAASGSGSGTVTTYTNIGGSATVYSSVVIDEVAIFNRALSQQEIARYYQWSLGRFAKTL